MTRVLHVITGLEHGGAERQLALLLRHLPTSHRPPVFHDDPLGSPPVPYEPAVPGDPRALHEPPVLGEPLPPALSEPLGSLPPASYEPFGPSDPRVGHKPFVSHAPISCEVAVLTRVGTLGAEIRRMGVVVHELGMRGNRDLTAVPRLARLIRRGRYDVVHTHLYRACVYGRIAANLAGTPRIVATEHSLGDGHIEGRATTRGVRALYRATERLGSVTVAVSPTVAARLRGWGVAADRVVVIPNGIDASAFAFDAVRRASTRRRLGIGPDEPVVGAVGRLVPTKRFDVAVEAVARLDGVRLLIAGTGPMRGPLERLAHDLGAADRVVFAGGTSDVPGVLAAMDVLAAPSVQEAFGLGVVEALAAGLPVLYTVCPAVDDAPPGEAPPAGKVPTDAGVWSTELRRVLSVRRDRTRVPPLVARYAIAEQAARLARLYQSEPEPLTGGSTRKREKAHDAAT